MAKEKKPRYPVGLTPTVNLLSNEHLAKREASATRKRGLKFVGGVLVFTLLGAAIPTSLGIVKQFELSGVETQVASLKLEQTAYSEVLDKQNAVSSLEAARISLVTNEIDWATFLTGVTGAIGGDGRLDNLTLNQADAPAKGSKTAATATPAATGNFTFDAALTVTDLNGLTSIEDRFLKLPGAVSVTFTTASGGSGDSSSYQVSAKMVFSKDILWNRFKPKPVEPAPTDAASTTVVETGE